MQYSQEKVQEQHTRYELEYKYSDSYYCKVRVCTVNEREEDRKSSLRGREPLGQWVV